MNIDFSKPITLGDHFAGKKVFCKCIRFDYPKAGDYYLSGAICEVWKAPNDLTNSKFIVVEPTHYAVQVHAWAKGEEFKP